MPSGAANRRRLRLLRSRDPLDVRLDLLAAVVDPAMRPRLLYHRGQILLPGCVVFDTRPAAKRVFEDPGGIGIGQLCLIGDSAAYCLELSTVALDDQFEG